MLAVDDVAGAAAWWRDRLGFAVTFRHRRPDGDDAPLNYAVVERDDVEVHLARRAELTDRRRAELTITVADLDALQQELRGRGVPVATRTATAVAVSVPGGNRVVFRAG